MKSKLGEQVSYRKIISSVFWIKEVCRNKQVKPTLYWTKTCYQVSGYWCIIYEIWVRFNFNQLPWIKYENINV